MIEPRSLDEFSRRLRELLPPGLGRLNDDVRRNARGMLEAALSRMELVTREEFDVQAAVLARTRERLEELERKVAELERAAGGDARATHS